jgi:hypothetical protein
MIGPEGGSLSSADGVLSLTIPAGAVSAPTQFSVTPIVATAPGADVAWRLGPEGTRFTSPATISVRYTEAEAMATEPRFLRIAFQDAMRRWRPLTTTVNEANRTVSVTTNHLSDWTMLKGFSLTPSKADVKVGRSVGLFLRSCDFAPPEVVEGDELAPIALDCVEEELAPLRSQASVNGVVGGNATFGTVVNKATSVTFTAPGRKPSPDVVVVGLRFNTKDGLTTVVANVRILDDDPPFPERLMGSFSYSSTPVGSGPGATKFRVALMGNATFTNRNLEGKYEGTGSVMVTGGFIELVDCDCDIQGGTSAPTTSLRLGQSTYDWGFASDTTVSISCRRRSTGPGTCPSETLVPISFDSGDDACPGTSTTMTTDTRLVTGSYSRTCPQALIEASWSFTGQ